MAMLIRVVCKSYIIQSTLSKTDTFGTGTKCPSYRESNKRSKEKQGPTLKCPFYRGVRLIVVSVKRELTVLRIIHLIVCTLW